MSASSLEVQAVGFLWWQLSGISSSSCWWYCSDHCIMILDSVSVSADQHCIMMTKRRPAVTTYYRCFATQPPGCVHIRLPACAKNCR